MLNGNIKSNKSPDKPQGKPDNPFKIDTMSVTA